MFNMNLIFSVKTSKASISTDGRQKDCPAGNSGFTLLELIVSMTIISMVVLVLYFAFSIGARSWDNDGLHGEEEIRLEAALRLMEDDLQNVVPFDMNWERGTLSIFAGGPRSVFYVTGNGTGAFSGAGAGLFFSILYIDVCPETAEDCLFLYKSSRPSPEFVRAVDDFKGAAEFQQEYFSPGMEIAEKSILILKDLGETNISYSGEQFTPFAGTDHEGPQTRMFGNGVLSEEFWTSDELPGQIRFAFSVGEREFVIQVPVGK